VVHYPTGEPFGYDELFPRLRLQMPQGPYVLLAESFSGPLAIRLAAERPPNLRGLILCASFARSPLRTVPGTRRLLAKTIGAVKPPAVGVRLLLAGADAPPELVDEVREALVDVTPAVIAKRVNEVFRVDVRDALRWSHCPLLYLHAERDRVVGLRAWKAIKAVRKDAETVWLDGPHLLLQRRPELSAETVAKWVGRLP
jgi:pimeloyl-ACP methyl ester carboxylesterase